MTKRKYKKPSKAKNTQKHTKFQSNKEKRYAKKNAESKPRTTTVSARVIETLLEQPNPRKGKESFFFGGEFEMPKLTGRSKPTTTEIAVMCCKAAVQCNLVETYWWAVYMHRTKQGAAYTMSIHPPHIGRGYSPQIGIILIKKSDTENMTEKQVAEMLDIELYCYSEWLSTPMAI